MSFPSEFLSVHTRQLSRDQILAVIPSKIQNTYNLTHLIKTYIEPTLLTCNLYRIHFTKNLTLWNSINTSFNLYTILLTKFNTHRIQFTDLFLFILLSISFQNIGQNPTLIWSISLHTDDLCYTYEY